MIALVRSRAALVACALIILTGSARAWDATGHMVVTRIAWMRLSPATRARVVALLAQAPADAGLASLRPAASSADADLMFAAYASTWPDIVRAQEPAARHAYHRPIWHYINWFWREGPDRTVVPVPGLEPDSINIVVELARQGAIVADTTAPAADRAVALAWVLHLGGDIAQPLHASGRVTDQSPSGDHGGNDFHLEPGMSLHWYWDRILTARYPRSDAESDDAYIARIADAVMAHAPTDSAQWMRDPAAFESWAKESLVLAQTQVYCCGIMQGVAAPPEYLTHTDQTAEPRIALAGYRLAALLTKLLGP
jgi:hypothetical protein